MELINAIPVIGPFIGTVLAFVLCLSIVVAIHELGHLMVGRWCGIRAEVYSIGFGKVLFSRKDKQGTVWQFALLPLGGFVKFVGDMDPSSSRQASDEELPPEKRPYAFHNAALWKRALTVIAGPAINFILSLVIFFCIALFVLPKSSDEPVIATIVQERTEVTGLQEGDRILSIDGTETETFGSVLTELLRSNGRQVSVQLQREGATIESQVRYVTPPLVTGVASDGAAIAAGIIPGDTIVEINGEKVASTRHLVLMGVDFPVGEEISIRVDRAGELLEFKLAPRFHERPHPETGEMMPLPTMGVMLGEQGIAAPTVDTTVSDAALYAVNRVVTIVTDSVNYINQMLFKGATTDHLSGPIGIAKHSANAANAGLTNFLMFIAFISTAIGFMNLLPIPILDGGHLMFYAAEAIRGRPANETIVKYGTLAGFSLLILLMVFVTFNNDLGLGDWLTQN